MKTKKTYIQFRIELLNWYRKNRPNSGLPSEKLISILYDDYLKE